MALDGQLVGVLPGDVEPLGDDLSGESHMLVVEDVPESVVDHAVDNGLVVHPVSPAGSVHEVGGVGHALHTSYCEDVVFACFDGVGGTHDSFHGRTADGVDCEGSDLDGKSCADGCLPGGVLSESGLKDVSHDAFLDIGCLDSGSLHCFLDTVCSELGGFDSGECFSVFSDCSPACA